MAETSGGNKNLQKWNSIKISDYTWLMNGFRGGSNPFVPCGGLIPIMLPDGPYGLLVLGPQAAGMNLAEQDGFVISASRELATRILILQLSQILREDRQNWRQTAQLTGHRIRSSLQNINSQLKTIKAVHNKEIGFGADDLAGSERDLNTAFRDLTEISYAAESNIRGALDVKSASRDYVPLGQIVWAAVEGQQEIANSINVEIRVSNGISALPVVWVNQTLMRFVFVNLINNGLKYSYPRQEDGERYLTVSPPKDEPITIETMVEIANFGLGIKEEDQKRIFDWGTRLVPGSSKFQEIYGKGIGLWEVKHIIEGHGGKIFVRSVHFTKAPVTDQNIQHCITVFTVSLPTAPIPKYQRRLK